MRPLGFRAAGKSQVDRTLELAIHNRQKWRQFVVHVSPDQVEAEFVSAIRQFELANRSQGKRIGSVGATVDLNAKQV